jgi:hypothetical protein
MAQPMDPIVRSSRGAFTAHLPLYRVPADLPPIYQHFSFGGVLESYHSESNKTRENTMALMARPTHKHGLLSERLLPLSEKKSVVEFSIR